MTQASINAYFDPADDGDEDDGPPYDVSCASCGTTFIGFARTQANGCASEADPEGVTGAYGSRNIDMERWKFTGAGRPDWVRDGTICDACVDRLTLSGDIVLVQQGIW